MTVGLYGDGHTAADHNCEYRILISDTDSSLPQLHGMSGCVHRGEPIITREGPNKTETFYCEVVPSGRDLEWGRRGFLRLCNYPHAAINDPRHERCGGGRGGDRSCEKNAYGIDNVNISTRAN